MNIELRTTILTALKNNEKDLLTFLKGVDESDFFYKPSEEVWSIAENLDHIIITEKHTLDNLKQFSDSDVLETQSRHPNGKVEYLVLDRNRKVDAPEYLVPKNNYKNKASAIDAFQKIRTQSVEFIQNVKRPLVEIGFPHITLGMLNGENWGTFIPAHCERHLKQIKELKLNASSKSTLLEMLKQSENKLLNLLENITEETFFKKTSESIWSAAELVEHIIIVETAVRMKLFQLSQSQPEPIKSQLANEQVNDLIKNKNRKVKAPDMFVPKGIFKDKTSAMEAFKQSRLETEDFVQKNKTPLNEIGFPHFAVGMLNGENWVAFMAGHCERHTAQMEDRIA